MVELHDVVVLSLWVALQDVLQILVIKAVNGLLQINSKVILYQSQTKNALNIGQWIIMF